MPARSEQCGSCSSTTGTAGTPRSRPPYGSGSSPERGVLTTASSCGIHARPGQHAGYAMAWAAAQQGIDLSTHGSRPLDAELLAQADLVLTLTRAQADHVGMTFGSIGDRLFLVAELAALLHGDHSAVPAATAGETFPDPDAQLDRQAERGGRGRRQRHRRTARGWPRCCARAHNPPGWYADCVTTTSTVTRRTPPGPASNAWPSNSRPSPITSPITSPAERT